MLSPISTRLLTSALVESPKESSLRYKVHPPIGRTQIIGVER